MEEFIEDILRRYVVPAFSFLEDVSVRENENNYLDVTYEINDRVDYKDSNLVNKETLKLCNMMGMGNKNLFVGYKSKDDYGKLNESNGNNKFEILEKILRKLLKQKYKWIEDLKIYKYIGDKAIYVAIWGEPDGDIRALESMVGKMLRMVGERYFHVVINK